MAGAQQPSGHDRGVPAIWRVLPVQGHHRPDRLTLAAAQGATVMTEKSISLGKAELTASWLPLIIIVIAQLQMGINVNALPVSLGPILQDLNAPATAVSTALVLYSLA